MGQPPDEDDDEDELFKNFRWDSSGFLQINPFPEICVPIPTLGDISTEDMPAYFRQCQSQLETQMASLSLEDPAGSF